MLHNLSFLFGIFWTRGLLMSVSKSFHILITRHCVNYHPTFIRILSLCGMKRSIMAKGYCHSLSRYTDCDNGDTKNRQSVFFLFLSSHDWIDDLVHARFWYINGEPSSIPISANTKQVEICLDQYCKKKLTDHILVWDLNMEAEALDREREAKYLASLLDSVLS
jgi:hypothetical protein